MNSRLLVPLWLLFLFFLPAVGHGGPSDGGTPGATAEARDALATAERLIEEGKLDTATQLLESVLASTPSDPQVHFLLGMVEARREQWASARHRFERTIAVEPGHLAAHLELAGVHFREQRGRQAMVVLRRALALDPNNDYGHRFLAALLSLEGDQIAALRHWNRVGEPRIGQIRYDAADETDANVLTRLVPLNEGEILRAQQMLDIQWQRERFGLGRSLHWQLVPRPADGWNLDILLPHTAPVSFPKAVLLENAAPVLLERRVGVHYPLSPLGGPRLNAQFRWEAPRKRAEVSTFFPFLSSSVDALRLGIDLRDESWDHTATGNRFLLETQTISADYEYLFQGRKSLILTGGYQHQNVVLQSGTSGPPSSSRSALVGFAWHQRFGLNPSDRAQLDLRTGLNTISGVDADRGRATQLSATAGLRWQSDATTPTEVGLSFSAGTSQRQLPLDRYFVLGVGQDTDLPLRAHASARAGRKGNSPMGRHFFLANLQLQRPLGHWRFLHVSGLAFTDTAFVAGRPFDGQTPEWFQDVGMGVRVGALGSELVDVLFGYDVKTSSLNIWVGLPIRLNH